MNTESPAETYPGFEHSAKELKKYIYAAEIFTLLLKDQSVIHFIPQDKQSFAEWLLINQIKDIRN